MLTSSDTGSAPCLFVAHKSKLPANPAGRYCPRQDLTLNSGKRWIQMEIPSVSASLRSPTAHQLTLLHVGETTQIQDGIRLTSKRIARLS